MNKYGYVIVSIMVDCGEWPLSVVLLIIMLNNDTEQHANILIHPEYRGSKDTKA